MKSLKEHINQLLFESFVNCKNEEEMNKYGKIVWDLLQKAYAYCGGLKNYEGIEDLIRDTHLWKLYRKDNEVKAVICYTDRKGGRKICLLGQDGSDDGRKMIKKMLEDDFRLKDRQTWTGVSGKAAITALKHGGFPIPAQIACDIMNGNGPKKCVPASDKEDEYFYTRPLDNGEVHYKIMVGNPPGHEGIEPPKELLDKLIKQAAEYGE